MRPHWNNAISNTDDAVGTFITEYFGDAGRRCLLVAAAGFDPRSQTVSRLLAATLGDRLTILLIREERGRPDANLVTAADTNEEAMRLLVAESAVERIQVFGDDGAPVGGQRVAALLAGTTLPQDCTDVVLDMTALSIGVAFPAARLLLTRCEATAATAFHLMISADPTLDDRIVSEPGDRPMSVRGFSGATADGTLDPAKIWMPHLARGRGATLDVIGGHVGDCYKICPILPFPSGDPRRADTLLSEHLSRLVDEWQVDPRDFIYVSERNPLDSYRTISTLQARYVDAVSGVYDPQVVLSPIGSKVMAAGALMAAIEHDLSVQYLETVRYDLPSPGAAIGEELLVHLLLSGPAYGDYEDPVSDAPIKDAGGVADGAPTLGSANG